MNNVLNDRDRVARYKFAASIQEELESFALEVRVCTSCLKIMIEGYVIDGGMDYYCSDKCLEYDMTLEEFEQAYGDGDTDTYWTEWY
ncbi:CDP-alcohol phosphatidyltransferase [Clostridium sp.]|uniref:CDP-alcohol phosphatidyltransferase n=1 Tax=Clostridium sp. TaxID=1506 RepID=UPI003F681261